LDAGEDRKLTKVLAFSLFLFAAAPAFGDVDLVTQSGEWGATCPPIVCSEPGDSWSYSFLTDSNVVLNANANSNFGTTITDFEYSLNEVLEIAIEGAYLASWFPESNDGGFFIQFPPALEEFSPAFGLSAQLYTVSPSSPPGDCGFVNQACTIAPGTYLEGPPASALEFLFGVGTPNVGAGNNLIVGPIVITDISAPEPTSVILLLTALLAVAFVLRKRITQAARTDNRAVVAG
jgi:hypothetical protein